MCWDLTFQSNIVCGLFFPGQGVVPHNRTKFADRTFSISGQIIWIAIPATIKQAPFSNTFKRRLKTHNFNLLMSWCVFYFTLRFQLFTVLTFFCVMHGGFGSCTPSTKYPHCIVLHCIVSGRKKLKRTLRWAKNSSKVGQTTRFWIVTGFLLALLWACKNSKITILEFCLVPSWPTEIDLQLWFTHVQLLT